MYACGRADVRRDEPVPAEGHDAAALHQHLEVAAVGADLRAVARAERAAAREQDARASASTRGFAADLHAAEDVLAGAERQTARRS